MAEEHRTPILLRPFKWLWLLAVGLYRTIFVLLMILLVVAFFAARQDHPLVQVKNGEALVIAPSGELVDELAAGSDHQRRARRRARHRQRAAAVRELVRSAAAEDCAAR